MKERKKEEGRDGGREEEGRNEGGKREGVLSVGSNTQYMRLLCDLSVGVTLPPQYQLVGLMNRQTDFLLYAEHHCVGTHSLWICCSAVY